MKRPTVVGTGLIVLDLVYRADDQAPILQCAGGTCGNVLAILAFLGWHSVPIGRLGADGARRAVEADLRRFGVDVKHLALEPVAPTPMIVERVTAAPPKPPVHRFGWSCPSCDAALPRYRAVSAEAARRFVDEGVVADVFFFDRVSPGALVLARAYAERGALVVFEPAAHGDAALLATALEIAHVVKYSKERLRTFPRAPHRKTLLEVQTLGREGLRYRKGMATEWRNLAGIMTSEVRDTAGCGDWITAGLLASIGGGGWRAFKSATEATLVNALERAQVAAVWNAEFLGARGGMYPTERERSPRHPSRTSPATSVQVSCPSCPSVKQRAAGR